MAWTAPATRTVGQILTAAFENTQIRDNQLAIDALLDLATGSFTDGGALHGSGSGTITALAVLADGRIHVGDGATDPAVYHLLTSSSGVVRAEAGGMEFDASLIAVGGIVRGTAGAFEILALGAAQKSLRVNDAGTQLVYDDAVLAGSAGGELTGSYPNPTVVSDHADGPHPLVTIETFETAITGASTFNTGALSKEPKFILVFGWSDDTDSTFFIGFATGTGSAAKSAGVSPDLSDGVGASVSGDADSVGGIDRVVTQAQFTAWPNDDLDVTVFSKASGITLDWSATGVAGANIKMLIYEFE